MENKSVRIDHYSATLRQAKKVEKLTDKVAKYHAELIAAQAELEALRAAAEKVANVRIAVYTATEGGAEKIMIMAPAKHRAPHQQKIGRCKPRPERKTVEVPCVTTSDMVYGGK